MTRKSLGIFAAAAMAATLSTSVAAACGRVTVANMNWQSAEVLAAVDKMVLEEGYGCKVEIVPGDTMPTLTSMMEKGEPDVAPEAWINSVREPLDAAVKEGRLHYAAKSLPDGGVEGWWIPKYIADANPGIRPLTTHSSAPTCSLRLKPKARVVCTTARRVGIASSAPAMPLKHGVPRTRALC